MLEKFKQNVQKAAKTVLSVVKKRRFLVTAASAVVMLALLMGIWNYFIFSGSGYSLSPRFGAEEQQKEENEEKEESSDESESVVQSVNSSEREKEAAADAEASSGENEDEENNSKDEEKEQLNKEPDLTTMQKPAEGEIVRTFGFSFSPTYDDYRFHGGIDISVSSGTTAAAALDGKVENVSFEEKSKYSVVIEHGGECSTLYSHLSSVEVEKGDTVNAGTPVGTVEEPGDAEKAVGPHLHFELIRDGDLQIDPLDHLNYSKIAE